MPGENSKVIQKILFEKSDASYKEFTHKLVPNIRKERIIGVRLPVLRKMAKELVMLPLAKEFCRELPHEYLEENHLHGFLIELIQDFDTAVDEIEYFLPYIDNWATCDSVRPKILKKYPDKLKKHIVSWIASEKEYHIRFGVGLLLSYYLDSNFSADLLELVASIQSDFYYVNMMVAWYFATALAKQPLETMPYFCENRLSPWVHRQAVKKARESARISQVCKDFLKTLV